MDKKAKNGELYRYLKAVLIGVVSGEAVTILLLLLCAFLMLRVDLPLFLTDALVLLSGAAGGFMAGYVCERILKQKGILFGAVCGMAQIVILLLFNFGIHSYVTPLFLFLKFAAILLCAVLGGILGVNRHKRDKY